MARKPVFTESQVIDAVAEINRKDKKINGTNLRLEVGSGSPQKLLETYDKLLAKGIVKDKSHSELEALELQLESSLEQLSRTEEELDMVRVQARVLEAMFIESISYIDSTYYESGGVFPFRNINERFVECLKEHDVNLIDDETLFAYRKLLLKIEREEAEELSKLNGNSELHAQCREFKVALADERYRRKLESLDAEETSKEAELKSKIEEINEEIRKVSPSLRSLLEEQYSKNKK
jgi:hypothetical protein